MFLLLSKNKKIFFYFFINYLFNTNFNINKLFILKKIYKYILKYKNKRKK